MSLSITLANALSGMTVAQAGLATVSQNIANSNTVGYSRQTIELQQRVVAGVLNGVEIATITRAVDEFLVRQMRIQTSSLGAATAADSFFTEIQARFGTPGNNSTSSANLADFAAALEALAANPEDQALRFDVVAAGIRLAQGISDLATSVQKLRAEADKEIMAAIDTINAQLVIIKDLNDRITNAQMRGDSTSAFDDQRDLAIATVAANMDITIYSRDAGELTILTADGRTLLDEEVRKVYYSPASFIDADTVFSEISIFTVDPTTGERIGVGEVIATSGTSSGVVSKIKSGRIQGLLGIRDGTLNDLGAQVEAFAATVRNRFNAVNNTGVSFPAPNALTGTRTVDPGDAFSGTGTVRISVVGGDGTIVGAPLDLDLTSLGAVTVGDVVTAINTALGANGTAAVVDGKLTISAANGANGIAINEGDSQVTGTTQAFSDYFGLNDLFTGADAATFAVRADIADDPSRLAVGLLSTTATTAETGIAVGDNRVALQLAALTETGFSFAATGGLPAGSFTLGDYAGTIIGLNAVQAANAATDAQLSRDLFNNLEYRATSFTGVNVDEEMVNMVIFQNSFAASARVMRTATEMFNMLLDLAG